ncbi:MAG: hypothetical protein CL678_00795 [Bdellovibrionaceae bacterium]|nr:hypothetical protein [Pseudobdellovibrionaceae bacterium]
MYCTENILRKKIFASRVGFGAPHKKQAGVRQQHNCNGRDAHDGIGAAARVDVDKGIGDGHQDDTNLGRPAQVAVHGLGPR